MRVERCDFSGYRIYPSKGKTYVRGDSKVGLGLLPIEMGRMSNRWNGIQEMVPEIEEWDESDTAGWMGWRTEGNGSANMEIDNEDGN